MRAYIALIHQDDGSDYGVSFPDLPGCVTAGETLEEAHQFAAEALALHLRGMGQDGEAVPEPSTLDVIMKDPENRDGVAILVPAPASTVRSIRVNVTLAEDVLERVDAYAEGHGYTRSGFLAKAASRVIEEEMA